MKHPAKIHTGTNFQKFGDGFFVVMNPLDEQDKLEVYTANTASEHNNRVRFEAILGQYQCILGTDVTQIKMTSYRIEKNFSGGRTFFPPSNF